MTVSIILICVFGFLFCTFMIIWTKIKKSKAINKARNNALQKLNSKEEFTPKSFLVMYESLKKNSVNITSVDSSGCYVFFNRTKGMNYIGQSKHVLRRINQHLNAKGNGDIYADYKYGDEFIIIIVKCSESELNITEKHLIKEYDGFTKGYNKNQGVGKYY